MLQRALAWAFRSGIRKGVVGGSGPWVVVAVAAGVIRFLNRPPKPAASASLVLKPGDRYSIVCSTDE